MKRQKTRGGQGPLTTKQISRRTPKVPTHEPSTEPLPSHITYMQVDKRSGPPSVSTRLTEVRSGRGKSVWRVELVTGGRPASINAPAAVAARLKRPTKDLRGIRALAPSMPIGDTVRVRPRTLGRPKRIKTAYGGEPTRPNRVFNPDGRYAYNDRDYPWRCVCRISSGGQLGSGVLVGPRHVLTASHVLNWNNLTVGVDANHFDGAAQASSGAIRVWYYTKVFANAGTTTNADEDFAVIVLSNRLGDRLGWMGTRVYSTGWDNQAWWRSIGYAGDMAGMSRPVYQRDFALEQDDRDSDSFHSTTTFTGDFVGGQSGSPTFAFWNDGPYVVAVHHGEQIGGPNWNANGALVVNLVAHARTQDP